MTKKDLLKMIEGKTMWNCVNHEDSLKARDEAMDDILDQIKDFPEVEKRYWTPRISEHDELVITYGNRFARFPKEVRGVCKVRSRDILVGQCHVEIKNIDQILENGFITKHGNKFILVD